MARIHSHHVAPALTLVAASLLVLLPGRLSAQEMEAELTPGDSVNVVLADTDLRSALRGLGRYLDKPILTGPLPPTEVSFFETPIPVPRDELPELIRGLVESYDLVFEEQDAFFRVTDPTIVSDRDVEGPARVVLNVIRLSHARAVDVAATVNQLYGGGGSSGARLSTNTLSDELQRTREATMETGGGGFAGADAMLAGPVTIVPDELTNALLVRATQVDFEVVEQAVAQLDVRPLQVLIEVLIVEARKDRNFSLGVSALVPPQPVEGGTVDGEWSGAGLGDLVLRVMSLGRFDLDAALSAASRRGDISILSRPVLVASNNTEAQLMVGAQQPFVQVSRSLPTDAPQRDQVIQYKDVGTRLSVLPTINADGYVSLLIQQEISAATGETQFEAPVISSREAMTNVLVRDGQTLVIGGLTDVQESEVRSGVPVLSSVPLIGGLFGHTSVRSTETELLLFITPSIVRNDDDVDRITQPLIPTDVEQTHFVPDSIAIEPAQISSQPDSVRVQGGSR